MWTLEGTSLKSVKYAPEKKNLQWSHNMPHSHFFSKLFSHIHSHIFNQTVVISGLLMHSNKNHIPRQIFWVLTTASLFTWMSLVQQHRGVWRKIPLNFEWSPTAYCAKKYLLECYFYQQDKNFADICKNNNKVTAKVSYDFSAMT